MMMRSYSVSVVTIVASFLVLLFSLFVHLADSFDVDKCPTNGVRFAYDYQKCANGTSIIRVSGTCDGGNKTETETVHADCATDWPQETSIKYCLECGRTAVCADSNSASKICPQVSREVCSGISARWVVYAQDCYGGGAQGFSYRTKACLDGSVARQSGDNTACFNLGMGNTCHNCNGLAMCSNTGCSQSIDLPGVTVGDSTDNGGGSVDDGGSSGATSTQKGRGMLLWTSVIAVGFWGGSWLLNLLEW